MIPEQQQLNNFQCHTYVKIIKQNLEVCVEAQVSGSEKIARIMKLSDDKKYIQITVE